MKKKYLSLAISLMITCSISSTAFAAGDVENVMNQPDIYGKTAITIDMNSKEIIYEKSIDSKMYPASTTKLITALLLAENKKKTDLLNYTEDAKKQPAFSLNTNIHPISVGETITAEDAMYGLLLYSGNDVAYMISENVGRSNEDFVKMMNDKVKTLHINNTHFVTPNGLHNVEHYSTAYDLSVIGRAAYDNPWVKDALGAKNITIKSSKGTSFPVENRNKLLQKDGCIGGKTGFTTESGKCLVAMYERNGRKIIGVVMKSTYDKDDMFVFNDMEKIINYSYSAKPFSLYKKDSVVKSQKVDFKPLKFFGPTKTVEVPMVIREDASFFNNKINKEEMKKEVKITDTSSSALKGELPMGTLSIKERDAVKSYKLYSSIPSSTILKMSLPIYLALGAIIILILAAVLFIIRFINLKRRRKRRLFR